MGHSICPCLCMGVSLSFSPEVCVYLCVSAVLGVTKMAARPTTSSTVTTETSQMTSQTHDWTAMTANVSGPVLFTGPNGLRDYRAQVATDQSMVGVGDKSHEFTSDLAYLSRPPPNTSFPLAKNGRIGEIGWPVEAFRIVKGI